MNILKAIELLYNKLDLELLLSDISYGYLTENTTRSGKNVLWYVDASHSEAIYTDTLVFLTEAEIASELC